MPEIESKLVNCVIQVREGDDALFHVDGEKVYANLDGYAIVPLEAYEKLAKASK